MPRYLRFTALGLAVCAAAVLVPSEPGRTQGALVADGNGNYDRRLAHNRSFKVARPLGPQVASEGLASAVSELAVNEDETTGAVSLSSHNGYLTSGRSGDAMGIALDYVRGQLGALGLEPEDLAGFQVTDIVPTRQTGATHIYLRQRHQGIPVYNAQLHINMNRDRKVMSVNNSFLPGLAHSVRSLQPAISLPEAVAKAMSHLGKPVAAAPAVVSAAQGAQQVTRVAHAGLSRGPIEGSLMLLSIRQGDARLVWNFHIDTVDTGEMWELTVDAATAEVWTSFAWTARDQYRVYRIPAESPSFVSPLPPSDGRTLAVNPRNATASPFGWHDTNGASGAEFTTTQGNNVHAYTDTNADNAPDSGSSPSGGSSLNFDFPIALSSAPSAYRPAAVTNLFYMNNIIHDVQYMYGFDEAAGSFQTNNYGRGGLGNDSVRAEAQDGSGTSNANFSTPPDGSRPRMQMYIWTAPTPDRDGDVDNGIVIHEYGHGISNRLVGGPSNVSCLGNRQQPGEGLSDWWAMAYTTEVGDRGTDGRGMGTYSLGQPTNGRGIRTQRYSTDPAINTWTYASINGMAVPHGVGSVWAQAAWEAYWALIDHWGFDPNLYNAMGSAGNQRMMLYVNEGLKNTACSPTFTQVRDGIIQAAADNHGGEDVCRLWTAFAAFGLGTNAVSGGSSSTTPTNGFNVPASCTGATPTPRPTATPTPTPTSPGPTPTPTATPSGYVEVTPAGSAVTASTNDGNVPANTVDNNLATRWSGCGEGAWIQYDLGTTRTVGHVRVGFYQGNARQARFDLQVSSGNGVWTNVVTGGLSNGTTTAEQTFDFTDQSARFVRYLGHGNTLNMWNSVTEVSIFAAP